MLRIENTVVDGWAAAIRGMRNPMNSWDKSDTVYDSATIKFTIGENDLDLMKRLAKAGPEHRKFMRMITVSADITGPLYWWKEYDTYKIGTVADSCSTMHKIHAKPFTVGDFSAEHLNPKSLAVFLTILDELNYNRDLYLQTKDKEHWWQMIQLLPSSYNQKRTVMINYEVARSLITQRTGHKLDEWHTLCDWAKGLPYAEGLIF